jgi:hypothetical protein
MKITITEGYPNKLLESQNGGYTDTDILGLEANFEKNSS